MESLNAWRVVGGADAGWSRDVYKISADCHANEPSNYLTDYIEPEFRHRLPHMEDRPDGSVWLITEGNRPQLVRAAPTDVDAPRILSAQGGSRMDPEDMRRSTAGKTAEARLADQDADGVTVELIFPNKGLQCWATPDPIFAAAMCRAWNRWSYEAFDGADGWNNGRTIPVACVAAGDANEAMTEIRWAADHNAKGLCFGNSPVYGPKIWGHLEYNDPSFEPVWSLVAETGLPITFHVSTGRDPRAVGGPGGAITNYVCHSMETTIEPIVQLITAGVLERHPTLQAGMVESGIGFVPWLLETMDYAHKAHHFWVKPTLKELPSTYFRQQCFATFQEDHVGLRNVEDDDLAGVLMWANDYPHHEGSWPHSSASIERQMSHLSDQSRANILGLNAARIFKLPVPNRPVPV